MSSAENAVPAGQFADQLGVQLNIRPQQQVVEMVVIVKCVNFETGETSIAYSGADGMDWVQRRALVYVAKEIMQDQPLEDSE